MKTISVDNISKRFYLGDRLPNSLRDAIAALVLSTNDGSKKDELWALKDVSFEVSDGETLGIIGRNGAGKSTLLKVLSRITRPTAGRAEICGRVASLLEVGTGFHHELTGRENIYLNGSILGMRRSEIEKKFDEIVAFSEVEKFIDTPVKHYSSGMYMRLAFSVAAHLEPEILIVDEVLSVGDLSFQQKCLGKMEEVGRSGRTVLFVSHSLGSLARICKRGILLHNGKLIFDGDIDETIDEYLSLAKSERQFKSEKLDPERAMQITEAAVTNKKGVVASEIPHDEEFSLEFDVNVNRIKGGAEFCVALLNKYKDRVFSEIKPIEGILPDGADKVHVEFAIPKDFIAPNSYSFLVQIYVPFGETLENLFDICPFTVVDTGSELAAHKDYGYVQMKADWRITKA
jgi:lipopolysaccharide transport system ATP-binding protein